MKSYSQDLRERVIQAVNAGQQSQAEIAATFGVSLSTLEKWWRRWRDTGHLAALPHAGGPARALGQCESLIRREVKKQPDATLAELCERVAAHPGRRVSPSTMCRELQRLKLRRKKKSLHDSQRATRRVKRLRKAFAKRVDDRLSQIAPRLKFLDEFGVHLGLTRLFGRAAPGERVVEGTPGYSGAHYTVVAALGWEGLSAPWLLEGAMDRAAFETYLKHVLGPTLKRGDVVLLDNLSAHTGEAIRTAIEAWGARLEFLPPYSPDLNPVEKCWAKIKTMLRTAKARTVEALMSALRDALQAVRPDEAVAWFAHCGYALP